jgi:hypothetical protein
MCVRNEQDSFKKQYILLVNKQSRNSFNKKKENISVDFHFHNLEALDTPNYILFVCFVECSLTFFQKFKIRREHAHDTLNI